jgi:hypothetical protein
MIKVDWAESGFSFFFFVNNKKIGRSLLGRCLDLGHVITKEIKTGKSGISEQKLATDFDGPRIQLEVQ